MDISNELAIAIVTSSLAAVSAIVSAWLANRNGKRQEKAAKDAVEYRTKRERLDKAKWKVLIATMGGVSLLLHQAHGEKLNGNVTAAIDDIEKAKDELNEVQSDILATS